jgi:hypothetical protein
MRGAFLGSEFRSRDIGEPSREAKRIVAHRRRLRGKARSMKPDGSRLHGKEKAMREHRAAFPEGKREDCPIFCVRGSYAGVLWHRFRPGGW